MSKTLKIKCREVYDIDALKSVLDHPGVEAESKKQLRALYSKKLTNGNELDVVYQHTSGPKRNAALGRVYPQRAPVCLAKMWRPIRNSLAAKNYWDVDMANAQMNLCLQICRKQGWDDCIECQEEYCSDREGWLEKIRGYYRVTRDGAKRLVARIYFGGRATSWDMSGDEDNTCTFGKPGDVPDDDEGVDGEEESEYDKTGQHMDFIKNLQDELKVVAERFLGCPEFSKHFKTAKDAKADAKKPFRARHVMALVLQDAERNVLSAIMEALETKGRRMEVLIHDGGLVRKLPGEEAFPEEVLRVLEKHVKKTLGYEIRLEVKAMKDVLDMLPGATGDGDYQSWKAEHEREHFVIRHPCTYIHRCSLTGAMFEMSGKDFRETYQNTREVEKPISFWKAGHEEYVRAHEAWMRDPERREFREMDFLPPPLNCPKHTYNLWDGMAAERIVAEDSGTAEPFVQHVDILMGGHFGKIRNILSVLAQIVQQPGKLVGISVILQGVEGAGKDTLLEMFELVLGDKLYLMTEEPDKDLFATHAEGRVNKLCINVNEPNIENLGKHIDRLKAVITMKKFVVNPKYLRPYQVNNLCRFFFTTNNPDSIPIGQDRARRYYPLKCSSELAGNAGYFKELYRYMEDPANIRAIYDYLMAFPLDDVDWENDRVVEDGLLTHMKLATAPPHVKFFLELRGKMTRQLQRNPTFKGFLLSPKAFLEKYVKYKLDEKVSDKYSDGTSFGSALDTAWGFVRTESKMTGSKFIYKYMSTGRTVYSITLEDIDAWAIHGNYAMHDSTNMFSELQDDDEVVVKGKRAGFVVYK